MGTVTVTNKEWLIIAEIDATLTAVKVGSATVFAQVISTTSEQEVRDLHFTKSPTAAVRYMNTSEHWLPDSQIGCIMRLEIILAARGDSEEARLQECLRLKNVVGNAMEQDVPDNASSWNEADTVFHRTLEWGEPRIDITSREPWGVSIQPLEVSFVVTTLTGR